MKLNVNSLKQFYLLCFDQTLVILRTKLRMRYVCSRKLLPKLVVGLPPKVWSHNRPSSISVTDNLPLPMDQALTRLGITPAPPFKLFKNKIKTELSINWTSLWPAKSTYQVSSSIWQSPPYQLVIIMMMVMMMICTYNHHLPLDGSLPHNSWSLLRPSINSRLGGTCFCKSRSCKLYWCGWWYIMVLQWFGWRLYWYSMVLVIVI